MDSIPLLKGRKGPGHSPLVTERLGHVSEEGGPSCACHGSERVLDTVPTCFGGTRALYFVHKYLNRAMKS